MAQTASTSPTPSQKLTSVIGAVVGGVIVAAVALTALLLILVSVAGPSFIQNTIISKTGFDIHAEKFVINPIGGSVEVKSLSLYNPQEWGYTEFVTIPEFVVKADLLSFLSQPYHVKELTLHVGTVNIIKNAKGELNAKSFADKLNEQPTGKKASNGNGTANNTLAQNPAQVQTQSQPQPKVQIDHLKLQVDTVTITDQTVTPAKVTTLNVGFTFERSNVTDLNELKSDLTTEATTTAVSIMSPKLIRELGGNVLGNASSLIGGAGSGATKAVEKINNLINIFKK